MPPSQCMFTNGSDQVQEYVYRNIYIYTIYLYIYINTYVCINERIAEYAGVPPSQCMFTNGSDPEQGNLCLSLPPPLSIYLSLYLSIYLNKDVDADVDVYIYIDIHLYMSTRGCHLRSACSRMDQTR